VTVILHYSSLERTIRYSVDFKQKTEGLQPSLYVKIWRSVSSSLHLFCFFILVFHLKQKHEEGQRLLHYLQQTNTALATGTLIYLINQDTCGKIKKSTILSFH